MPSSPLCSGFPDFIYYLPPNIDFKRRQTLTVAIDDAPRFIAIFAMSADGRRATSPGRSFADGEFRPSSTGRQRSRFRAPTPQCQVPLRSEFYRRFADADDCVLLRCLVKIPAKMVSIRPCPSALRSARRPPPRSSSAQVYHRHFIVTISPRR